MRTSSGEPSTDCGKTARPFESWLFGRFGPAERAAIRHLRDAVWPEEALCCACDRVSGGGILCPTCREDLEVSGFVFSWEQASLPDGTIAWAIRPHAGIHRELIHRLKYGAEARAAEALTSLLLPLPEALVLPPDTVVTWVTMPESRRRDRFIDHGQLLARSAARQLNLPCRQLLRRRGRRVRSQVTLSVSRRKANLKGAFEPMENLPASVLLIDDVRTTGTTLSRCAGALRAGGTQRITAITMTHA